MGSPNKLTPDPRASGIHTTFMENLLGMITKYATWVANKLNPTGFDEQKRVDMDGKRHFNKGQGYIDTPHVHERNEGGQEILRKAAPEEIPKRSIKKKKS